MDRIREVNMSKPRVSHKSEMAGPFNRGDSVINKHFTFTLASNYEYIILSLINLHLLSGPVHPYQLDESISNFRGVWCTFSFVFYF